MKRPSNLPHKLYFNLLVEQYLENAFRGQYGIALRTDTSCNQLALFWNDSGMDIGNHPPFSVLLNMHTLCAIKFRKENTQRAREHIIANIRFQRMLNTPWKPLPLP
jgi:hypothetical protein